MAAKPTARLVRHLRGRGWEPVVLAPPARAYPELDPVGYADVVLQNRVERSSLWPHPFDALAAAKLLGRRVLGRPATRAALNQEAAGAYQTTDSPSWSRRLRKGVRQALSFPDLASGWIVPAFRAADRLMRAERFDAILSVAPPVSAHLAALMVKRRHPHAVWFAQFHDPWSLNPFHDWPLPALGRLEGSLEAAVLRGCDRALFATEEAAERYTEVYGDGLRPLVLHNGFDPDDFPTAAGAGRSDGRLTFTYTGSLYGPRDPEPFLRALADLVRAGRVRPDRVRVRFVGDCAWAQGRSVRALAEALGLADVVELVPPVPYPEALGYLAQSDVLLLFAEGQPMQVPAKLFEYLHVGRNILGLCTGASARIIEETGSGRVGAAAAPEAIAAAIADWADAFERGPLPYSGRPEEIGRYRADALAGRLAEALDEAVAGCRRVGDEGSRLMATASGR